MIFWRKSFSGMSDDKFRKEYSYNIKHTYGQVGSRINYTPKRCAPSLTRSLFSGSLTTYRLSLQLRWDYYW